MVCKMVPGDNTPAVSNDSEGLRTALIVVQDMTSADIQVTRTTFHLVSTAPVSLLVDQVASSTSYVPGTFELQLQRNDSNVVLSEHLDKTLEAAGFICDNGLTRNTMVIADKKASCPPIRDPSSPLPSSTHLEDDEEETRPLLRKPSPYKNELTTSNEPSVSGSISYPVKRGFVGLVNQAMTCYLNSLIQTLFMTPEFRNALYRWRFDGTEEEQAKSIPFQLQSLFLKLQTTDKPSIGTTQLTRSFGWDSSEAWQQHDIQELCRVMFDALEHKFRRTEQSDLISRLYEGKMMDYVRCLECQTEKAREDTFLDIPLPVRPFGSQIAYSSVEEALKAFVAPETLDGNNQYWCDRCGKKCDAHKGLKFSRFPYLLTLHLKRFDFDYTTLHRVKLNDKVTFPEFINLDSFLVQTDQQPQPDAPNQNRGPAGGTGGGLLEQGAAAACQKDSQDTAMEDSMSEASESSRANSSSNGAESQDDDEGIDVRTEGCTSSTSGASGISASDPAHQNQKNSRTRYRHQYELFSIMIHSGSASGGHYYAYIKDFPSGEWHCFNDQSVSRITHDDIRKTYGGGPSRSTGYFTSAYTSSTNAYMLMYREIDKERNSNFMRPSEFPEHLQHLLIRLREEEESARVAEEQERNTCKIQLYCHHPKRGRVDYTFKVHKDTPLCKAVSMAYEQIGDLPDAGIGLEQCRLVKYNQFYDSIECSWDHLLDETVDRVYGSQSDSVGKFDLLLEITAPGRPFEIVEPESLNIRVVMIDVRTGELGAPVALRIPGWKPGTPTVRDLKIAIKNTLNIKEDLDSLYLVSVRYSEMRRLTNDNWNLVEKYTFHYHRPERVYVTIFTPSTTSSAAAAAASFSDDEADDLEFTTVCKPRFYELIDTYENALTVRLTLPKVDSRTLDRLGIPSNLDSFSPPETTGSTLPIRSVSPVLMDQGDFVDPLEGVEEERSYSPDDEGGDAGSDDSLSNLERERALSEGEEEEEENRRRRREDIEQFAAGSAHFRSEYAGGDDMPPSVLHRHHQGRQPHHKGAQPNSTLSSASEDSNSLSLTDSDRTLLGNPREMEEAFVVHSDVDEQMDSCEASPAVINAESGSPSGRRNALVDQGVDSQPLRSNRRTLAPPVTPSSGAATELQPVTFFFKVISKSEEETGYFGDERLWTALVDKRIPLTCFKAELQKLLNVPSDYLLVYKKINSSGTTVTATGATVSTVTSPYASGEREWIQPTDTLETLGDDPHVLIRLGRALKPGEFRGKIFQFCVNPEPGEERSKFLFEWVLVPNISIAQMKLDILAEVQARFGIHIAPEKCVLRKKTYRTPTTMYGDEDDLVDATKMYVYKNWEMFLQLLDRPDQEVKHFQNADTVIFTRRWRPSTLTLEEFVDTPLPALNRNALAQVLTSVSGLASDQIEIAKAPGSFPCEGPILAIQESLSWIPLIDDGDESGASEFRHPCYVSVDGEVVYWREKGEPLKKLTEQERRDLAGSDVSASGTTSTYSPRKERPLRILLDSPCVSRVDKQQSEASGAD